MRWVLYVAALLTEEITVVHRQPSKVRFQACADRASLGPSSPEDLEAHSFKIGSDESVLVSFPLRAHAAWHDGVNRLTASEREVPDAKRDGAGKAT